MSVAEDRAILSRLLRQQYEAAELTEYNRRMQAQCEELKKKHEALKKANEKVETFQRTVGEKAPIRGGKRTRSEDSERYSEALTNTVFSAMQATSARSEHGQVLAEN